MSNASKQPISGLRTVTRDWSSGPTASQEMDAIGQPSQRREPSAARQKLSGLEQRLKDIQDALSGNVVSSESVLAATTNAQKKPIERVASSSKRPSPGDSQESTSQPPAKKRQLPGSWSEPAASGASGSSRSATSGAAVKVIRAPGATPKPAPVFLSQEQTHILRLVEEGQSVFYTGSAGTGKSVLLREIIKTLKKKYAKSYDAVAITASTGMAACNIGGVTIHSFAGIGLGIDAAPELVTKVKKNRKASSRWLRTKVLIIDEVSMVEADLFDKLSKIGEAMMKKSVPFGGIQLVVTGDFFQLPPVTKRGETRFAFEAECWSAAVGKTFNLTKVFRQRDQQFIDMLNEMRFGRLTAKSIAKFKQLSREVKYEDGLGATELFPLRDEVERSNQGRMRQLGTESHTYRATDGGTIQIQEQRDKLLANFMAPSSLTLRIDAQVMLIKNMDETLVNGSTGKIVRFVDPALYAADKESDDRGEYTFEKGGGAKGKKPPAPTGGLVWPVVQFATPNRGKVELMVQPETWKVELPNGEVQVSRTQLPLILAWAMSIHKSQGQTLERVKVDLGKVFEKGQAYVALSRATSLEGLQVLNFDPLKVQAHPKVVKWSQTLETIEDH